MFNWKPTKETLVAFLLGCAVVSTGHLMRQSPQGFLSLMLAYLQVVLFGFILPIYYTLFIWQRPLSELGITKKHWLISIVLNVIFCFFYVMLIKNNIIGSKKVMFFLNPDIIKGFFVELLVSAWETIFFLGFLHLQFRKTYGLILSIILSSIFLSSYYWHYEGNFISMFIFTAAYILIFSITKNILIIFPFLKGTFIFNSLIENPKEFEALSYHLNGILLIFLSMVIVSVYFYAKKVKRNKFKIKKALTRLPLFIIIFVIMFAILKWHHLSAESKSTFSMKEDPILFWRFNNNSGWINSLGFRDKEYTVKKNENTFRIICISDSATFGYFVDIEETFSKKLEVKLNEESPLKNFEVINAGVVGYSSYQGVRYLQEIVKNLNPDLIIAYFGFNDATPPPPTVFYSDKVIGEKGMYKRMMHGIILHSLITSSLPWGKHLLSHYFGNKRIKIVRVSPEEYENNLNEINAIVEKKRIKIIYVKPFWQDSYALPRALYEGRLPQNSLQIDLLNIFHKKSESTSQFFKNPCHLSPLGHEILAEEIREILIEKIL